MIVCSFLVHLYLKGIFCIGIKLICCLGVLTTQKMYNSFSLALYPVATGDNCGCVYSMDALYQTILLDGQTQASGKGRSEFLMRFVVDLIFQLPYYCRATWRRKGPRIMSLQNLSLDLMMISRYYPMKNKKKKSKG